MNVWQANPEPNALREVLKKAADSPSLVVLLLSSFYIY